ncbi:MAG: hypothetical protein V1859_04995 [archaeon]
MNKMLIKRIVAMKKENLERIKSINESREEENKFLKDLREALEA